MDRYQKVSPLLGETKGGAVEPLEAMVPERQGGRAARRPVAPAERLQAEPVLVTGEDVDGFLRVALGFVRDHLASFFAHCAA